jgi:hypothetical protein
MKFYPLNNQKENNFIKITTQKIGVIIPTLRMFIFYYSIIFHWNTVCKEPSRFPDDSPKDMELAIISLK